MADIRRPQLAGQPFAAIEADMHRKGKPGLQPRVQQAQLRIEEVVVVMQALADASLQVDVLGRPIAVNLVSPTRFHATEHTDQSLADPIAASQFPRQRFLVLGTAGQVTHGPTSVSRHLLGRLANLLGELQGMGLEVLEEDVPLEQITAHPSDAGQ